MGRRSLDDDKRVAILLQLLTISNAGELGHQDISATADAFDVHRHTAERVWKNYKTTASPEKPLGDVLSKYKGNSGRKGYSPAVIDAKVRALPLQQRSNIRSTANGAGVSVGVIQRRLKSKEIVPVTTTIKPILKKAHRERRMQYALGFLSDQPGPDGYAFDPMLDIVHVDEKWFNHNKKTRRFYTMAGEDVPSRHHHKSMFLAAVARPRWDPHRKKRFDGKIGVWSFTEEYIAKKTSKNRPAGTKEQKNMESIDASVYKHFLLDFVFPAIKAKWPRDEKKKRIYVQQDNARPHVAPNDPDVVKEGRRDGWDIMVRCQPANSPDYNVLDLGYFSVIQSLQYTTYVANTNELIAAAEKAFEDLDEDTLDNIFLTLQQVMECVLSCGGGNVYKLPHLGKAKLRRVGKLPQESSAVLPCMKKQRR